MTKAQQTYERVEALVAAGSAKADAFRQLAAEYGQPVDSVRGAYYTGRKQATGETSAPRARRSPKRETTERDAVERAIASLENSIADIESEVEIARERAEEAQRESEAIQSASGPRIETIRAKIAVLSSEEVAD